MNPQATSGNYVGKTIRDLRLRQHLTGEQLARHIGISQSKISRIENGSVKLQPSEIENLLNILEAPLIIRQQFQAVINDQASKTRSQKFNPLETHRLAHERERATGSIKIVSITMLPVLLQTLSYRQAILSLRRLSEEERAERLTYTLKRQELLWNKSRQFHFIFVETALYSTPAGSVAQIAQLDRIRQFVDLPHVRIGVIPLQAGLPTIEFCPFCIYGEQLVVALDIEDEHVIYDAEDINNYLQVFASLERIAQYGHNAAELIDKAQEHFRVICSRV